MIKRKKIQKNKRGFVLMEMIVALFIFSLMITSIIAIFISSYRAQRKAEIVQRDVENVRVALEIMAKSIRTSTLDYGDGDKIYIYDHSQDKCIKYEIKISDVDSGKKTIKFASQETNRLDSSQNLVECDDLLSGASTSPLISETLLSYANFNVQETSDNDNKVGEVTIILELAENNTPFQTTVSLRDYYE